MIFSVSNRRIPAWKPLALVSALSTCFLPYAFAQDQNDKTLPQVVVTASRFANDPALAPIGASVITADEIRSAGIDSVNQAVRKIGGVFGRQSLNGTQDFDLDLRGFGVTSSQNMVVLVDGIRLSENEQAVALLSSISIETVERIEIMRGGSSVLYGDGATGGVINVITKRGTAVGTHGSVTAEAGQFNHRAGRASVMKGWDGFSLDANVSKMESDNYRDNNAVKQENFSGGVQWASKEGRAGFRVDAARQDSRFPGPLTMAQFESNPRQTLTPNDYASIDTDRYTAFVERKFGAWEAVVELSHREKTSNSFFEGGGWPITSNRQSKQTQFSPRLRNINAADGMTNELVVGADFINWDFTEISNSPGGNAENKASQKSKGFYIRDEAKWDKLRLALGARHEIFDKDSIGKGYYPVSTYSKTQALNAWELQGNYVAMPLVTAFAKVGQSYRVANADDNAYSLINNEPLKPQISHDLEVGGSFGNKMHKMTAKLFQHRLRNEVIFDAATFTNISLDPTRRRGIEIEGSFRLAPAWVLLAHWQHVNGEFTEGPNAGREVPLVPKNIVTARLNWLPAQGHSASAGVQWVNEQRYGNDLDNTYPTLIPSYFILDARYARRMGPWELAITGENLTDRNYFSYAIKSQTNSSASIYPSAGRQLKVSARYDF